MSKRTKKIIAITIVGVVLIFTDLMVVNSFGQKNGINFTDSFIEVNAIIISVCLFIAIISWCIDVLND